VDDDELGLWARACILAHEGYRVTTATSAEEALLKLADRFDAIITDRDMPGMNGTELAAEVRRRRIGAPIIMLSGRIDLSPSDLADTDASLCKGDGPSRLLRVIDDVLDRIWVA